MGNIVVESSVFAVGFNEQFIIAKQHPNTANEILERLNEYDFDEKAYYLNDLSDTIWLQKKDNIYKNNGKFYHKDYLNRNQLPDSLKPYKKITNYYIIDLRNYEKGNSNSYKVHKMTEKGFLIMRKYLDVPEDLTFTIINPELE